MARKATACVIQCNMAGTITGLTYQQHNRERVSIYLDGSFAFGLPAIVASRLRVGQALSDVEIAALQSADDVERAYGRALDFLSYRPRSEAEVRSALHKKGLSDETIDAVVARLQQAGLLNDAEFAHYWVENRSQFNPRGLRALRYELRRKGLPDAVIADELAAVDEGAASRQLAELAARRFEHLAPPEFRRKLGAFLARRGFSYATIEPLVNEAAGGAH